MIALLARGREAGVSVLLATQELADLDRAGRGLRDQVLGNTALKIAHRQDVPESAATVAQLAGTMRCGSETRQIAGAACSAVIGGNVAASARQVERLHVEPERSDAAAPGEAIVILKRRAARSGQR